MRGRAPGRLRLHGSVCRTEPVYGILATGGNAFGMLAPVVTGYLISGTGGYETAFQIAGALLAVGAIVSFLFTRTTIGTQTPEWEAAESRVGVQT
jgi:dipeptide/tripeptide permease